MKKTARRNVSKSILMAAVILGSLSMLSSVFAAEPADEEKELSGFNLDQIVVTAGRVAETNFDSRANVNVVTRKDIETNHYQTVSDALKQVPGVTIQNYSATGANYSSDYLYINGTSHVVVLVDGQRANTNGSVSSVFQPSEISNMDNIERIEVLKGSASTLYGSDAIGGVINIITRKPDKDSVSTKVGVTVGSYNKRTFNLYNQGMTANGFYWTVNAQKDRMDEYKDGDGNKVVNKIDSTSYGVKIGQKFSDKADVNLTYSRYKLDYVRPKDFGMNTVESTGKKDNEKWALNFDYNFDEHWSNHLSFFSRTSDLDDDINHPVNLWLMRERTWGLTDQVTFKNDQHTLIAGFDYYKDTMKKYQDQYTPALNGSDLSNKAFFIQDTMKFGRLSVTPGVRVTRHSEFGSNTSWSGVVGYDINDNANIYASYKQFFRAPYMYELYAPFYGNEKLRPEKGDTFEVGTNFKVNDKTTFSAHVFRTDSDNLIGFNNDTWQYYNAGAEKINGWDLQASHQLAKGLTLSAAYTHLSIGAKPGQYSNRNGYIPKGTWDISLNYDSSKFNANFNTRGIMNRPGPKAKASEVSSSNKTFWIFNLALNYRPIKELNIFVKGNNLFNRMYTETCYDMRYPGGAGWYSQPGRNFIAGVEYTF